MYRNVHTEDSKENTNITIKFRAVLAPVPDIGNQEIRYVTVGITFGSMVWIGQAELETEISTRVSIRLMYTRMGVPAGGGHPHCLLKFCIPIHVANFLHHKFF